MRDDQEMSIKTGIDGFDDDSSFPASELIIASVSPSTGKTCFAASFLYNAQLSSESEDRS